MSNYKPYPAYKDSGVEWIGDVPEGWEVARLRHIASFTNSNVDKKSYTDQEPVNICNYTDVYYHEFITESLPFMEATASESEIKQFALKKGDLIITKDSEDPADIGIPSIVVDDLQGVVCGYHLTLIRTPDLGTARFLHRVLQSHPTKAHFFIEAPGITRYGLGQDAIGNVPICLPPISFRQVIADWIDRETARIDALIAKKSRFIELLKEKRQALITHAVTKGVDSNVQMKDSGVEWIGKVPAHWKVLTLRRVISHIEQGWSPECSSWPAETGKWGVLKAGCVNNGQYRYSENKALPAHLEPKPEYEVCDGDILMSRANGSPEFVGSVALIRGTKEKLMLSDKIFRIRLEPTALPEFFVYALNSKLLRFQIENALSGGNGLASNLPQSTLLDFVMCLPPVNEQQRLVEKLQKMLERLDLLALKTQRSIDLLKEHRAALITAAVTGKIDLRESV